MNKAARDQRPESRDGMDVDYVAGLARIQLQPGERDLLQRQMDQVLDYVRILNEPDVSGVEPTAHPCEIVNVMREDVERPCLPSAEVMAAAPAWRRGLVIVPKIME